MKTWIVIITILIGASLALVVGVFALYDDTGERGTKKTIGETRNPAKEFREQTKKVGGVTYHLEIDESSSEDAIVNVMHEMTHQKVKADKKWGAIPMIPETIDEVHEVIKQSDFKRKDDLLEIAERWKKGDFSKADRDHNYFWRYKNGNIGEAYGVMSEEEEREFILNNFGEEYLPQEVNGN